MFTPQKSFRRTVAVGAAVVVAIALGTSPVHAHTELRESSPEEGATVEALDEVRLEFSSALLEIGSELAIVDSAGETHALTPEFPAGENAVVAVVDATAVAAGDATLEWRIVAEDGHPIEGVISFSYAPAAAAEPPLEEEAPAQEPEVVEDDLPEVDATPVTAEPISAEIDEEAPSVWVWVLAGLAVAGLVMTVIMMNRKRDAQ